MRRDMMELQRQLVTGQKADSYGGLGFERRTSLDARAKLAAIESYSGVIEQTDLRIKMMTQNLERLGKLASDTKSDLTVPKFEPLSDGRTFAQKTAEQRLKEAIDLLNTDLAGRSLFAGRAVDTLPVASYESMIDGDATGDGLRDVIAERVTAEGGTNANPGRLTIARSGTAVTLAPQASPSDFGFRVDGVSIDGAPLAASGSPPTYTLPAGGLTDGQKVTVTLSHPSTGVQTIELTARTDPSPAEAATSVTITAGNPAETAEALASALTSKVKEKVDAVLLPAVTMEVTDAFFRNPDSLRRVVGDPAAATALADPADDPHIVAWYRGDPGSPTEARGTAPVRVDESQVVAAGAQANEDAIVNIVSQLAVTAVTPFDSDDGGFYAALAEQVFGKLADKPENPKMSEIVTELANSSTTMAATKARHAATQNMLLDAVQGIEKASDEETSVAILELQTRLQASYQTTSILSRLSLVNYL
jgi:flagellin-like hook-associated protein FlgL